ncbi:hypothetical protein V8G54_007362 [Vigna mungo]|uniref:Uncharacterized protein n=1 Tax=Vigna mungo TaxID=3915 RepID=A0AAQ3P1L5_VIGMU
MAGWIGRTLMKLAIITDVIKPEHRIIQLRLYTRSIKTCNSFFTVDISFLHATTTINTQTHIPRSFFLRKIQMNFIHLGNRRNFRTTSQITRNSDRHLDTARRIDWCRTFL